MERKCLNNIVSLHFQKCQINACPNSNVCYHLKKENLNISIHSHTLQTKIFESENTVYESICTFNDEYHTSLMSRYKNYNITVSCNKINPNIYKEFIDQLQVSVYNITQALEFKNYQKLFLIKDRASFDDSFHFMNDIKFGKIHLIIEQSYLERCPEILFYIINKNEQKVNQQVSLDTCLTSWVINGHCPYETNYIDLTYDGSFRKCPYQSVGHIFSTLEIALEKTPVRRDCIYYKLFQRNDNERKFNNTSIQNITTNNRSGSGNKRMRRFSLRS